MFFTILQLILQYFCQKSNGHQCKCPRQCNGPLYENCIKSMYQRHKNIVTRQLEGTKKKNSFACEFTSIERRKFENLNFGFLREKNPTQSDKISLFCKVCLKDKDQYDNMTVTLIHLWLEKEFLSFQIQPVEDLAKGWYWRQSRK